MFFPASLSRKCLLPVVDGYVKEGRDKKVPHPVYVARLYLIYNKIKNKKPLLI
jgi:hypothetical protein